MRGYYFKIFAALLLICCIKPISAQNSKFYEHLIQNELFTEAEIYLREQLTHSTTSTNDSIYYNLSRCKNAQGQTDSVIYYLQKIKSEKFSTKVALLSSQSFLELNKTDSALKALSALDLSQLSTDEKKTVELQQSGICLLKNDLPAYEKMQSIRNGSPTFLSEKEELLDGNYQSIKKYKKKSPFVAGLLSGIVPGLGKIYSGKPKQGFAAFTVTAIMAAQTIEGYRKGGYTDPRFIIFGTIASVFYVSNIYGSALSVSVEKRQRMEQIQHEVKLNISIPVRYFFK